MTTEKIKRMLDACYQAKRYGNCFRRCHRELPRLTFSIWITFMPLEKQGIQIKISDISDVMNLPRPGVTRTVKEMETKGYLRKISSPDDGRVTYISITEEGRKLSQKYNEYYFGELVPYLSEISEEEADWHDPDN